jgi:Spy/CpxP family protein refolding chaperone
MSRQLLLTVLVFVVALGSGVVIGLNLPRHGESPRPRGRSWLADELKLTPEQRAKMETLWSELLPGGSGREGGERRPGDARRRLYRERDEAIAALIPAERKAEYENVLAHVEQQMADMRREQEKAFQKAVEGTKAILNPDQRSRYEELLKKGSFGPHRPGTNPAATQSETK